MIRASRTLSLEELATALDGSVVRCVRLPEPHTAVRGVVLHTDGDPAPDRDLLVLCAAPKAGPPDCAGIVVRESAVENTLGRVPATTAVFAASDSERWSDVYDRMQWAVGESFGQLAEHDAFHLADALATAVGGAVAIEDARRRVVAFSTVPGQPIDEVRRQGILGRQVPEHVERERWYAKLWRSTGTCEFTPDSTESMARIAVPVRAGAEPLGSIWALGDPTTLNPGAADILERSVGVVAACLAHQDHFAARSREARTQVLRRLLGAGAGAGADDADSVGLALPGPIVLVALVVDGDADDQRLTDMRLADVLSLKAHRFQGSGLAAALDGRVYALLPATERGRLETYLRDVVSRTALPVGGVAISDPVERVRELAAARRRVDRLLALRRRDGLEIMYAGRERDRLALAELADAVRGVDALRDGMLNRIDRHDREHGTAYLPTLRAWFETSGDIPAAAALLHLHPNTFRYRMARAGELFGLRLDRPDQRLLLHLQLRLAELELASRPPQRAPTGQRSTTSPPLTTVISRARFTTVHTWFGITRTRSPTARLEPELRPRTMACSSVRDSTVASGASSTRPCPRSQAGRSLDSAFEPASSTTSVGREALITRAATTSATSSTPIPDSVSCCRSPKT
jgi:hypothetical protein